ncbi:phenylacetate-CoA oxygenase/reductase subunit PaaK [Roseateles sp. DAIF2]|uniref:1,2-phenylacetyl-CoA epoxidase subunit PaaE n=1 Tax=Roseateles sp. DAIF2 TaxID=2714952 RepID=UPI0018A2C83C|nr:1,2-phenylacetyl-CoA epoxidase subunit PaaE [Roseateles sp. DAIF2]QPF74740.1 phenylacetate-CoA oxygenase/reductase subunit PaaK [Roseateles sp. DAIF2]
MSLHFHPLRVREVRPDTDEAVVVSFEVPAELAETFRFTQGQYLTLRSDIGGQDLRRSYSICAGVDDGELRVGVRKVDGGQFSSWVHGSLKAGDEIQVFPPQGRFGNLPEATAAGRRRHYVGIAAGSGITPILSIMKTVLAREPDSRFTLIYGNRRQASTMFKEEIEDLKNQYLTRLALHHVFSREAVDSPLLAGRLDQAKLTDFLKVLVPAAGIDQVFVCGPFEMNQQAEAALLAAGVPEDRIHIERFGTPEMQTGKPAPHEVREGDADAAQVIVIRDGISREIEFAKTDPSLLDAAARAGMDVPFSCKSGVCSTCRCKLLEGEVRMDKNFALDKAELAAGFILSCQAHALTPRVVISFDER